MRLKHFLAQVAALDGWFLVEGDPGRLRIRRPGGHRHECPLTAVHNSKLKPEQRPLNVCEFLTASLALGVTLAVPAAADDEPHRVLYAPENIAELRQHLLKATRLA